MDRILHAGYADKPYSQFLEEKFKISGQLREAIIYAIAIADAQGKKIWGWESRRTSMYLLLNNSRYTYCFGKDTDICKVDGTIHKGWLLVSALWWC